MGRSSREEVEVIDHQPPDLIPFNSSQKPIHQRFAANMSANNIVRFFTYKDMGLRKDQLEQLVRLAYLTARDRKFFPKEVLIRYDTKTLILSAPGHYQGHDSIA